MTDKTYKIRKAAVEDLPRIEEIYETARQFMRANGNYSQWDEQDAPELRSREDIEAGQLYVLEDEKIHAVFVFWKGADPLYAVIEQGQWMSEEEYGVVHRVASDGTVRNVLGQVMEFCKGQIAHLRIDTHEDNKVMQHVLEKNGFQRCGVIYVSDGSPRIAYELV